MTILKRLSLLPACLLLLIADASENNYFLKPQICSAQRLSDILKDKTLDMCWNFGKNTHFRFVSGQDGIYFEIYLGLLPDIYDDFLNRIKYKCIRNESEQLVFSYKLAISGQEEMNVSSVAPKKNHPNEYSYIVADRRIIANANPKLITQEDLETIIKNKQVLFYTGAGLSLASGIPAMNELNTLLGFEVGKRFIFSLEKAIEHPREFVERIKIFHNACLYSAPTPAHIALRELALYKHTHLITENLDCLHEASGIVPYRVDARHLREEMGGNSLVQFDYIICIGLSFDDRGFLGWYKEQHPQGKIVAVDICKPSYLGDEDLWLQGDLQMLIPNIQAKLAPYPIPIRTSQSTSGCF